MKNNVAKYFSQKSFSVLDLICIAMAVIGAIVGTVVWGGGPIGFGLLGIAESVHLLWDFDSNSCHFAFNARQGRGS